MYERWFIFLLSFIFLFLPWKRRSARREGIALLGFLARQSSILSSAPDCPHCKAKKSHLEPPGFCCSNEGVSLLSNLLPDDLARFSLDERQEALEFRKDLRTYI